MAYANSRFGYQQTQIDPTINNRRPSYFEEDDSSILDPAILDADIMQSPDDAHLRKGSFANSNGVLSPADSQGWEHQYGSGLAVEPASAGPANQFHEEHNGFVRQNAQHAPPFGHPHHPQAWSYEHGSGHCTPTTGVEFVPPPPPYDGPQYGHHRADSAHESFSHAAPPPPLPPPPVPFHGAPQPEVGFIPALQVQTPMSPHSHQDWMTLAQQDVEGRPMSKRMRPSSPPRTTVDYQRRDGIRKKNGRIDIPQERNIQTIDELIESTTDEDFLRELKQQKRLLRNREAALASRQRKKKHTEDLESREKDYSREVGTLQNQIAALDLERQTHERNHQIMIHRYQEAQRTIEMLREEHRDIMMKHTEETSSLRKKIQVLTDQLEADPAPAMSAAPSSTGFTDFNAEMEALNMGPHDWDNFIFVNDLQNDPHDEFTFDPRPESAKPSPLLEKKSSSSTIVPSPPKKSSENPPDPPIASGLLFFLLLCGAFVASKPASSQPSDLPQVPADVRAAAPTVLDNLLSESGASSTRAHSRPAYQNSEPGPSGLAHANTRSRSRLDHMHERLTSPTKQQEIDSAFSLTTAQYASITNADYPSLSEQPVSSHSHDAQSRPRRNLAEVLANMQEEHTRNSKAEVYTRSLLWDQIPTDVVKQFKELVRDHNEIEARQQQQQQRRTSHDEMFAYKVES